MTQEYNTTKFVDIKMILEFAHEDDNTEDKLYDLYERFMDRTIEWAEMNNAHVGMFADITSEAEQYGEELDDDDLFTTRGRLMTDEDYADLEDEDEEEEEVVLFWVED